ncbi:hypothetical protein ACL00T_17250 [Curtobacterium flaccumfaciens]
MPSGTRSRSSICTGPGNGERTAPPNDTAPPAVAAVSAEPAVFVETVEPPPTVNPSRSNPAAVTAWVTA